VGSAFSVQNSSKVRATNIDITDVEGVAAEVYYSNPYIGAAGPCAVGIFLKGSTVYFTGESIFHGGWLLWLRICKVGWHDEGKTSGNDVRPE